MKHLLLTIAILGVMLATCSHKESGDEPPAEIHEELPSVYYWKTVFHLDSSEMDFVKRHRVGRIYLRMFDVSVDPYSTVGGDNTFPNASVKIDLPDYSLIGDSLHDKEFVPVVFITLDALKAKKWKEGTLARNIVTRVRNMCEYNELPNVGELQLDCDWTPSTEQSFFNLCDSVKDAIEELKLPWRLSSTIRLHQLAREAPPVDNGVLMVYNTGSYNDPDARNSILSMKDVAPYLKHLPGYPLHLDVAYPTYSWQLLFRERQFIGLLNGLNLADTTMFSRRGANTYIAKRDVPLNDRMILAGDLIREEQSEFPEIAAIKKRIDRALPKTGHSNILYHLDSKNLSKYTDNEIDQIFSTAD